MNTAKKYEMGFALLCLLCVSVFGGSAALSARLNKSAEVQPQSAEIYNYNMEEKTDTEAECEFMLLEYNGKICVYNADELTAPIMITDIDTASLRSSDRELFKNGVGAADREELLALLEDFGS